MNGKLSLQPSCPCVQIETLTCGSYAHISSKSKLWSPALILIFWDVWNIFRQCLMCLCFCLAVAEKENRTYSIYSIYEWSRPPINKRVIIKFSAQLQKTTFTFLLRASPCLVPWCDRMYCGVSPASLLAPEDDFRLTLGAKWTRWEPDISGQDTLFLLVWLY